MNIFSKNPGVEFHSFSALHFVIIAVFLVLSAATVIFSGRIRENEKLKRWLPVALCAVALILEAMYHVWNFYYGTDFVKNLVPLELCSISLVLSVVLLATKNQAVFEIYYFFSIGAFMALAFPSYGGFGPDHFRFYHFFFCHSFLIWLAVYFVSVLGYRLSTKSLLRIVALMIPLDRKSVV